MGSYNEISEIENAIKRELTVIMEGKIAEDVKTAITQATVSEVYMAHDSLLPPEMIINGQTVRTRRWHNGGLADKNTYKDSYDPVEQELKIEVKTDWQQLLGGAKPGNDLADVIENNGMYHAPARPFINEAEHIIKNQKKQLEETIADHLNRTV